MRLVEMTRFVDGNGFGDIIMTESCSARGGVFGKGGASLGACASSIFGCGLGAVAMTLLLNVLRQEYVLSVIHLLASRQLLNVAELP